MLDEPLFSLEINDNRYPGIDYEADDDDNRFIDNDTGVDTLQLRYKINHNNNNN